ncbi:MAG: hypothetical protein Q9209_003166 [Squamulea sp. 1 TL-2023]
MAILHGVTVRLVSKITKDGPREFVKSNTSLSAIDTTVERYIEAWPGMDFHIEVYFSRDFNSEIGWGIMVGIKLDGGVTHGYHWTKTQINRFQMSGSPIMFDGIEKTPSERLAFRFGSMKENIDWALGDADSHAADLSTIEVEVRRVKVKRTTLPSEQPPRALASTPRKAVDLAGDEISDVNFTNALWRKRRSAPPVLDAPGFIYETDETVDCAHLNFMYRHGLRYQLQVLGAVHPVAAETPTAAAKDIGQHHYTSRDFKMLAEKVDHLEKQLKESQEQTARLIEKLVGGIHTTIQSALEAPRYSISTPAQHSGVKRKRRTEEVTPIVEQRPIDPNSRNYYGD